MAAHRSSSSVFPGIMTFTSDDLAVVIDAAAGAGQPGQRSGAACERKGKKRNCKGPAGGRAASRPGGGAGEEEDCWEGLGARAAHRATRG